MSVQYDLSSNHARDLKIPVKISGTQWFHQQNALFSFVMFLNRTGTHGNTKKFKKETYLQASISD